MCLTSKKFLKKAEEDIICYKWVERWDVYEPQTLIKRLFGAKSKLLKRSYVTPYMQVDVTNEIENNGILVAKGERTFELIDCENMTFLRGIPFDAPLKYGVTDEETDCRFKYDSGLIHALLVGSFSGTPNFWLHFTGQHEIYKCIIPKGTLYAVGEDGDNICAERMRIISRIDPRTFNEIDRETEL